MRFVLTQRSVVPSFRCNSKVPFNNFKFPSGNHRLQLNHKQRVGLISYASIGGSSKDTSVEAPEKSVDLQRTAVASSDDQFPYYVHSWNWRGHRIRYTTCGCGEPILLVHGFGASMKHWRANIPELAKKYKVYAVDLLGFGGSDKPVMDYTMELWCELLQDFMTDMIGKPAVVVGNSLGSLISLMVSADPPASGVKGTVLVNCAGGMNNKAITDDWRIKLVLPLILLIDWLLRQRPIADWIFNNFRKRENIKNVLLGVYSVPERVDDFLVDLIYNPSCDDGALDAFVSIITGPAGPRPEQLMPKISHPLLLMWGDNDNFTPLDGPVGRYFQALPESRPQTTVQVLQGVGHCPHDEVPDVVHSHLMPWLDLIHCQKTVPETSSS